MVGGTGVGLGKPNEILEEYKAKYGLELGEVVYLLRNDHADLRLTYKQYRMLFGTNKERVDLLNRHGGSFFFNVERQFWNSCLLSLCRMTDPAKQGKKENLTLFSLEEHIEDKMLSSEVASLVLQAKKASEFARERRNKRIGHSDFEVRTERKKIASTASRNKMKLAIDAAHKPLALIAHRLGDTDLRPTVIDSIPNEISLLYSLFAADYGEEVLNEKRRKRWMNAKPTDKLIGNYPYPDWLNSKEEL